MPDVKHYDNMLFNYETTNRTDFQDPTLLDCPRTVYKGRGSRRKHPYKPLKDFNTVTDLKSRNLPTELYVKPKEIVKTDPHSIQEPHKNVPDEGLAHAQATRPRLVMTPALSMDDIEDPSIRGLLLTDVYKTTLNAMQDEILSSPASYRAPLNGKYSLANPITLHKLQPPMVPAEWRMDSVFWESRQLRGHCDPDKDFYLSKPWKCDACDFTSSRKLQSKTPQPEQ
ncbi:unnamed protein product [Leptosia nina]|uniref:Uncharacterized protein n=1 Tax=Leptosia nina TaxID=320188 RepID=A0AAV1JJX8_9NEOP